jgi:hypothetical protein
MAETVYLEALLPQAAVQGAHLQAQAMLEVQEVQEVVAVVILLLLAVLEL